MPTKDKLTTLKQKNRCPNCGGKKDRHGYYCTKCLKKRKEYSRQGRESYEDQGRCKRCAVILDKDTGKTCPKCSLNRHMQPFMQYPNELNRR